MGVLPEISPPERKVSCVLERWTRRPDNAPSYCLKSGATWTSRIVVIQADSVYPFLSPSPASLNIASLPNLLNAPHASLIKSPGPIHPKSEYMQLSR